jgi:hypothetical protein
MYGLMTALPPVARAIFAVHAANLSIPVDAPSTNSFFVPSARANRMKATFWIWPNDSVHCTAGIVLRLAAAGQLHTFIIF